VVLSLIYSTSFDLQSVHHRGKWMLPHLQLSTNCGLGCFSINTKYFSRPLTACFLWIDDCTSGRSPSSD
jgi:hypothetical protein